MEAWLSGETDLAGFRNKAQNLLARKVPPEAVHWSLRAPASGDMFTVAAPPAASRPSHLPKATAAIVPASFLRLCELVVLHRDPERFALLYRLLWRLVHEPTLRRDAIDADMVLAQHMAHAVRRDMNKMKLGLRLHAVHEPGRETPLQVAWYEPAHHIVESLATHFARQLAPQRWAILAPELSLRGEGGSILFGLGVPRAIAPGPRAGEAQWLAAYHSAFASDRQQRAETIASDAPG